MKEKLTIGIVGYGFIGRVHAEHLATDPRVGRLVVVSGTHALDAQRVATAVYDDLGTMLDQEKLDGVCLCTPHDMHRAQAELILARRIPLLLEKPVAGTREDCDTIVAAAESSGTPVMMAHSLRYDAAFIKASELIHKGTIGEPRLIMARYVAFKDYAQYPVWKVQKSRTYGGVLLRDALHVIDMALWFMQSPVRSMWGQSANLLFPAEVEDTFLGIISCANGGQIEVTGTSIARGFGEIGVTVFGTEGSVYARAGEVVLFDGKARTSFVVDSTPFYQCQMRAFVDMIVGKTPPPVTIYEGCEVVRVILSLYESAERGSPVVYR
jgi:predicted dehydrogenase